MQHEKERNLVLLQGESVSDIPTAKHFCKMMWKVATMGYHFLNCVEPNSEDKIVALQYLKSAYEREFTMYEPYNPGLCYIIDLLYNTDRITSSQYLFLYKIVRFELQERVFTKGDSDVWLCDINDRQTRLNFLKEIINTYKE